MTKYPLLMEELQRSVEELERSDCTICRNKLVEPTLEACGHVFCEECLTIWLEKNNSCPSCRQVLHDFIGCEIWATKKAIELVTSWDCGDSSCERLPASIVSTLSLGSGTYYIRSRREDMIEYMEWREKLRILWLEARNKQILDSRKRHAVRNNMKQWLDSRRSSAAFSPARPFLQFGIVQTVVAVFYVANQPDYLVTGELLTTALSLLAGIYLGLRRVYPPTDQTIIEQQTECTEGPTEELEHVERKRVLLCSRSLSEIYIPSPLCRRVLASADSGDGLSHCLEVTPLRFSPDNFGRDYFRIEQYMRVVERKEKDRPLL